jgi:hypothetical protein
MRLLRPEILVAALGLVAAPTAHATDTVIANATGIRFPGDEYAYGGALTLQHAGVAGGVLFGLNSTRFPIGTLTDFDADAYRVMGRWAVTAGGSLGRAAAGPNVNTLQKAHLLLDYQVDTKWTVHAGDTYVHLARVEGQLLNASAEYRLAEGWSFKAGGGCAITGIVDGRTGYDPAALGQISVVSRLLQLYSGASIPIGKTSLLLGLDTLDLEGRARQSLRIGFSRPITP